MNDESRVRGAAGGIGLIFRALAPHAQSDNHSD